MTSTPGARRFHSIVPGAALEGDWFPSRIPGNVIAGEEAMIDSSFCFKHFYSKAPAALIVGREVTLGRTNLATEEEGVIEIGDGSYLANASLVCSRRITIGRRVLVAGGVTIADADFHPLDPALRLADTVALSPIGDRRRRPAIEALPVVIGDDVWIGPNATILKGVRVGDAAVIEPGALVIRDVPAGGRVSGNPARPVSGLP